MKSDVCHDIPNCVFLFFHAEMMARHYHAPYMTEKTTEYQIPGNAWLDSIMEFSMQSARDRIIQIMLRRWTAVRNIRTCESYCGRFPCYILFSFVILRNSYSFVPSPKISVALATRCPGTQLDRSRSGVVPFTLGPGVPFIFKPSYNAFHTYCICFCFRLHVCLSVITNVAIPKMISFFYNIKSIYSASFRWPCLCHVLVWCIEQPMSADGSTLAHSWSWALEKPPVVQPLKNFLTFYGTPRFIAVFTRALHWSLSWARSIQSIPFHPILSV
jgi:hypothetical protein